MEFSQIAPYLSATTLATMHHELNRDQSDQKAAAAREVVKAEIEKRISIDRKARFAI